MCEIDFRKIKLIVEKKAHAQSINKIKMADDPSSTETKNNLNEYKKYSDI